MFGFRCLAGATRLFVMHRIREGRAEDDSMISSYESYSRSQCRFIELKVGYRAFV